MELKSELLDGVLRIEVRRRRTAEETRRLVEAMFAEREKHNARSILLVIRDSDPLFRVEEYGLSSIVERIKSIPGLRVAGVSDSRALRASHDYVTLLAGQRDAPMRNFMTERDALAWLQSSDQQGS